MFGLMRAKKCGMTDEEKHFRRLNYCGTCKTAGALYGQKARLMLNHDAVFLAEVLSSLSGEDVKNWQKAYQSFNCMKLPKSDMPIALEFAATANVVLTEFKLADHIKDSGRRRFKLIAGIFSKEFRKAEKLLKEWNFPIESVRSLLETQESREAKAFDLEETAFPTAETTAVFLAEGARLVGKPEAQAAAREVGFAFGKLIYLVDAFEDYEKDFAENRFNAFRAAFGLTERKLTSENRRKIVSVLREAERETIEKIYRLPIAENQKALFASRLSQNLQRKLKTDLPVVQTAKSCSVKTKKPRVSRWQTAKEKAYELAQNYSWQMPLVFLFVFVFALVAPAQTREARSARECFDLSFNLMFLGAVFGSVLALPRTLLMENPEEIQKKAKKKKKEEEEEDIPDDGTSEDGCCGDCCCDCCGEGCGEGCDCCCCDHIKCDCCDCDGCCCGDCCCDCGD
jgi:hypothetical protein